MRALDGENYTLTKKEMKLTKGTYEYKVFKNSSTTESYPDNNASLEITEDGAYDVTFTFNTNTKELTASATKKDVWTIAGDEGILGIDWDATDIRNKMKYDGEKYILTKYNLMLPLGSYQFKAFKNFSTEESYPIDNASLVIEENAIYGHIYFQSQYKGTICYGN